MLGGLYMHEVFKKKINMKKKIIIVAIVLVVIVILAGAGYYIWKMQGKDQKSKRAEDPQTTMEEVKTEPQVELPDLKEGENETNAITVGIDVSEFQGNIDWRKVAESGIDFAMIRVGYRGIYNGEITEDACAKYNLQEATKYGIKVGAYFFSTAITEEEAKEEAEWTKTLISNYAITYPVAYNCEGFRNVESRQYELTVEERTNLADVFLETIEQDKYVGMFYAAKNELEENTWWNTDDLELKYRIWVAHYSTVAWPDQDKPEYDGDYVMWQYANNGKIDGIEEAVDFDVAYLGYSQAGEAVNPEGAEHVEANLEVGVKFQEVSEQVTAKDEVNLRSSMDQGDDSNVVGRLKNGETAERTGIGNNGWSRVVYQGQVVYCVSTYITTDLNYQTPEKNESPFKTQFQDVYENVTAKDVTNLRNRPSVEEPSEVIAQLKNGEVIVRTGIANEGWSRVEYNGQVLYCISSYLQVVN